jgi:MoxR-like ATPase
MARALAFLEGRSGVGFEDVARAVPHVFGHRLILSYSARLDGLEPRALAIRLHEQVEKQLLAASGSHV